MKKSQTSRVLSHIKKLKKFRKGKLKRTDIANEINVARVFDRLYSRGFHTWGFFGQDSQFTRNAIERVVPKIKSFLRKDAKLVRILDLGAGTGEYWDKLVERHPELKGKIKVVCLNPTRAGFKETKVKKLFVGSPLALSEARFRKLLKEGKFI
jgi:ubiquinone/menaquinone biosynthesis C-methylase UbiE